MVLVVFMYVCMYVYTFKLTPTMCLLKMSLLKYFYRIFFFFCFVFFLFFFFGRGVREGSIMSGLPHKFNDFQLTQSRAR